MHNYKVKVIYRNGGLDYKYFYKRSTIIDFICKMKNYGVEVTPYKIKCEEINTEKEEEKWWKEKERKEYE